MVQVSPRWRTAALAVTNLVLVFVVLLAAAAHVTG